MKLQFNPETQTYITTLVADVPAAGATLFGGTWTFRFPISNPTRLTRIYCRVLIADIATTAAIGPVEGLFQFRNALQPAQLAPSVTNVDISAYTADESLTYGLLFSPEMKIPLDLVPGIIVAPGQDYCIDTEARFPAAGASGCTLIFNFMFGVTWPPEGS